MGRERYSGLTTPPRRAATPGRLSCSRKGWGACLPSTRLAEGPFPEHYEPMETPLGTNPLHPNVVSSPVVRLYEDDAMRLGKKDKFPYVGTTYRLTEHFHTWTKHARLNAIAQPEQFVEISEALAKAKGIANGDTREGQQQARLYSTRWRWSPVVCSTLNVQWPAGGNRRYSTALGL